jgi:apurinic endonuclease APN1
MMRIGGHVSAAGGLSQAIPRAVSIGANAIQIFGSSPRQWRTYAHAPEEVAAFRKGMEEHDIAPAFLHAPYLINLAAPSAEIRQKSRELLGASLKIADMVGAKGVIFHIGSGAELDKKISFDEVVRAMKIVLKEAPGDSLLIAENSAGGGGKLGSSLEEIGAILDAVNSKRAAACFDTAHAFEAGMVQAYDVAGVKALASQIKQFVGWDRLAAIHANDSKTPFNSHHDRHENIGEGFIGKSGFKNLLGEKDFRKIPWLLEVPGYADEGPDKKNVEMLKKLAGEK